MRSPLNRDRLIFLRLGLGRDSFTKLALLREGRLLVLGVYAAPTDIDAVVFTDPGYEWPQSYAALADAERLCAEMGVPLLVQAKPPEALWGPYLDAWKRRDKDGRERIPREWQRDPYPFPPRAAGDHGPLTPRELVALRARCATGYYHDRPPILEDYQVRERIIQKRDASCTVNHKVVPNRKMMAEIAQLRFGVKDNAAWGRDVRRGTRPKHIVLLGIAADEMDRVRTLLDPAAAVGYEDTLFPLVDAGITRAMEAPILARHGLAHITKSGCMMCKYQGASWYWAMSVVAPEAYARVLAWEEVSKAAAVRDGRPLADARIIRGPIDLRDAVGAWHAKNPAATPERVFANEYRACSSRYAADAGKGAPTPPLYREAVLTFLRLHLDGGRAAQIAAELP